MLIWLGSTPVEPPNPPPTSPDIPEVSNLVNSDPFDGSVVFEAHTFPLDPQLDQRGYALANSQLNFDPDNITPGPYDMQHEGESLIDAGLNTGDEDILENEFDPETSTTEISSFSFDDSPTFVDMLLRSADFEVPSDWHRPSCHTYQNEEMLEMRAIDEDADDDVEEVIRGHGISHPWAMGYPSPSPSDSSSSSNGSLLDLVTRYKEPTLSPFSPEMLVAQFASLTCGILSIKDGPTENPWRTMLLPMASGVPALHYAILSLSAFHASRQNQQFRIVGLKHMQKSIHYLSERLGTMRRDTALATTLVLAFSESWEQEISTGIRHLKAARKLVTQAVANQEGNADFEEMERLKFLRNTWVYMDVIARITANDTGDLEDLDALFVPVYGPQGPNEELDPLMGCATSLFPLIGRGANLVREVRKTTSNSPRIVSRAAALKAEIHRWRAPDHFETPQDESIEIAHSLNTAEAYRWAILLLLFQAVPMIASESPAVLAERILSSLVSVPLSSRVIIIQIFPLLVAGCELMGEDNRLLVEERWTSMTQRMTIGNLDRCWDVVHEVWKRRDEAACFLEDLDDQTITGDSGDISESLSRRSTLSPTTPCPRVVRPDQLQRQPLEAIYDIDQQMTVRGHCHWLTVMEDWNWAGTSPLPQLLVIDTDLS